MTKDVNAKTKIGLLTEVLNSIDNSAVNINEMMQSVFDGRDALIVEEAIRIQNAVASLLAVINDKEQTVEETNFTSRPNDFVFTEQTISAVNVKLIDKNDDESILKIAAYLSPILTREGLLKVRDEIVSALDKRILAMHNKDKSLN